MTDSQGIMGQFADGKSNWGGLQPTGGWDGLDFSIAKVGDTARIAYHDFTDGGALYGYTIRKVVTAP